MKKILAVLGFAVAAVNPAFAHEASVVLSQETQQAIMTAVMDVSTLDVINWKVGDAANYVINLGSLPFKGSMVKSVTKDEGTALWITQDMNMVIQKQKAEVLMNKADGKILKMIVNGKEQAVPEDKIEIISQDYTTVTVPAGTFDAIHVVAKTEQVDEVQVWANPRDTVMEGTLKQVIKTQGQEITMELKSFKRAN